ncbi:hypothetical protein U6N27_12390, partial [Cutibacterium acnes]
VSGAPTRVPVRAQRGPCSPRLLPLRLAAPGAGDLRGGTAIEVQEQSKTKGQETRGAGGGLSLGERGPGHGVSGASGRGTSPRGSALVGVW